MPIQDTDLLLVNRAGESYKIEYSELKENINSGDVYVGPDAPDPAENGDLWWDTDDGRLYIYYEDGNSNQWVEASPQGGSGESEPTGAGADAWAKTLSDGSIQSGFNIASVSYDSSTFEYTYTFAEPMQDVKYAIFVTPTITDGIQKTGVIVSSEPDKCIVTFQKNDSGEKLGSSHSLLIHATNATLPAPLTHDDLLFADGRNASTGTQEFQGEIQCGGIIKALSEVRSGTLTGDMPGVDNNDTGYRLFPSGVSTFSAENANAASFNRRAANGTIISLRKNGTQRGSIDINDTNISITGLAGGPLLRNSFDLNNSEGVVGAIQNVVDRIAAIESNEIIDDATDTSLLQLLANASARLDSIEARLSALEGGN